MRFVLSVCFLCLATLLRWAVTSMTLNPCTPDFLGLREENPPVCPKLAYVPIFGELVVVANAIRAHRKFGDRKERSMVQAGMIRALVK